jgi:hypothetical protein
MSTVRWIGGASSVAQIDNLTVGGTIEAGDEFKITVTGEDGSTHTVQFDATDTSIATTVAGLVSAWNTDTNSLCTPITAADASPIVTLTADTAGVPFYVTVETTESGGGAADDQTFVRSADTANSGANDWNTAANWSGGAVPVADDDVYVEDATIYYGMDQDGITLDSLNITGSKIGQTVYDGYLPKYLIIEPDILNIGASYGPGTKTQQAPILISTSDNNTTINIYDSTTNSDQPAVWLKTNNTSQVINVFKGVVGVGWGSGETSTVDTINILYSTNQTSDSKVYIGSGVTLESLNVHGGISTCLCGVTTGMTVDAGTISYYSTDDTTGKTFVSLTIKGGTFTATGPGTITALNSIGGTTDLSKFSGTVTTPKYGPGATIRYDVSNITLTNDWAAYDSTGIYVVRVA